MGLRRLAWIVLVGCGPTLSKEIIRNHPRVRVELAKPMVVEASDPIPPIWTRRLERGAVAYVPFSGQSSGTSMDGARGKAMDDLLVAVSSFVSVEVESDFRAVEVERTVGGRTEASVDVRSEVRTRTNAVIQGVEPNAVYWEKIQDSPLSKDAITYRVYLLARVPKVEIEKARLRKMLDRQKKSGKRMVVVMPFRPSLPGEDAGSLAYAFLEEISRRLAAAPNLHVSDPGLVGALLAGKGEAESLETVRDVLGPDFVVGGSYQLHKGSVRVTHTLYAGEDGRVIGSAAIERKYEELFSLEDALVAALSERLSAEKVERREEKVDLDAYALYVGAGEDYRGGKNDEAIAKLTKAITMDPSFARAHLRLGHVLERLGRYGRIVPRNTAASDRSSQPSTCVAWNRVSDRTFEEFLGAREGGAEAAEAILATKDHADVDHVYSAVDFILRGGFDPKIPPEAEPSAAGSYFEAYRSAKGDLLLELDVLIALADLLARVDRVEEAERLYVEASNRAATSIHHQSLAHFGLGRTARLKGRYEASRDALKRSLELRGLLGEKPYILEIYNELGHLGVETADYVAGRYFYGRALAIAVDLGDDYMRAVLSNNIGVLLIEEGRLLDAEPYLMRAFDHLKEIGESEGRIASGLNIHLVGGIRGDRERARAYLEETRRLVLSSNQESRFAELYAHRGFLLSVGGDRLAALRDLLRSWAIFQRLGRPQMALRLSSSVAAAELYELSDGGRAPIECLRDRYHRLLEDGYGFDESQLARAYYYYGRWGYQRPSLPVRRHLFAGELGAGYYYALLNAEVMARMSGGGW